MATEISTDSTGAMILNSINDEGFFFNNAGTNAFKLDPTNATFAGNVSVIGSAKFIEVGSANTGTNFGFIGWNAASKYLFIGNSYNSAYNENLVINSSGNVGIGTTSPSTKLDVRGGTGGGSFDHATFTSVTSRGLKISTANSSEGQNSAAVIYNAQDGENYGSHAFQVGGSTKMFIKGNNVGIGTTNPQTTLEVNGGLVKVVDSGDTAFYGGDYVRVFGTQSYGFRNSAGSSIALISLNGNSYFNGGNVGIGTTTPAQPLSVHGNFLVRTTNADGNKNRMQCIVGGSSDAANLYLYYGNSGDGTASVRINAQGDSYFNGGNVGIGTDSPGAKLDVVNNNNYEDIKIGNSRAANVNKQAGITAPNYTGDSTSIFQYATNAGGNTVYFGSADGSFRGTTQLSFMISSSATSVSHSQMLRINAASINAYLDQYIIKTTPTIILEGRNSGNSGAKLQFLGWANTHDNWELGNAMAGQGFQFRASATAGSTNFATVAVINSGTGVYTATSDVNRKKDFEDSEIGLKEVMELQPKLFRMKTENENSDKHLGFIAQEVKEVIPQAYLEENGKDDTKFIGIQDRPIIAALTKAIQELKAEIELLKNK